MKIPGNYFLLKSYFSGANITRPNRIGMEQNRREWSWPRYCYYNTISKNKLNWYRRERKKATEKYASSTSSEHFCAYLQPLAAINLFILHTFSLHTYFFRFAKWIHIIQLRILSHLLCSNISFYLRLFLFYHLNLSYNACCYRLFLRFISLVFFCLILFCSRGREVLPH